MVKRDIIAILTDFGLRDPYVAIMKGVILSIAPHVKIIDITHEVEKFNVKQGAFILASVVRYFPRNTIYLCVVDPGVGTKRRPIIVETNRSTFVGPDNGILMLAAHSEGILRVIEIRNPKYMLKGRSSTFHGRDIFAPAAAYLAIGVDAGEMGEKIEDYIRMPFPEPAIYEKRIIGEIIYIDGFGNVVTNIPYELLKKLNIKYGDQLLIKFKGKESNIILRRSYGLGKENELLAVIDSFNLLEIAINKGSASKRLGAKIGDQITVEIKQF